MTDVNLLTILAKVVAPSLWTLAVKGFLLTAFTLLVVRALQRRSVPASVRHLLCACGVLALLLLPALAILLPAWRVMPTLAKGTLPKPVFVLRPLPVGKETPAVRTVEPNNIALHPTQEDAPDAQTEAILSQIVAVLVAVYFAGVLLRTTGLTRDLFALRRLCRRAATLSTGTPLALATEEALRRCGVRRPVRLLVGDAVPVPLTAGGLHPVILLPECAAAWPPERLDAALLHEAAHIRRGDYTWLLLARLACALHWPNPLAGRLLARLRAEAERACDDRVLVAGGLPAAEYADHLLAVVQELKMRVSSHLPSTAVAMARQSEITSRVKAILASGIRRGGVAPIWGALLLLVTIGLLLPMAALRASTPVRVPIPDAGKHIGEWKRRLADGTVVEVVGIASGGASDHSPTAQARWWRPDGTPNTDPFVRGNLDVLKDVMPSDHEVLKQRDVFVRVTGPGAKRDQRAGWDPYPEWLADTRSRMSVANKVSQPGTSIVSNYFSSSNKTASLRFGVAISGWEDPGLSVELPYGSAALGVTWHDQTIRVLFNRPVWTEAGVGHYEDGSTKQEPGCSIVLSHNALSDIDYRFVAVKKSGGVVVGQVMGSVGGGEQVQEEYFFVHLRPEQIASVRLEARRYDWLAFDDIALEPSTAKAH